MSGVWVEHLFLYRNRVERECFLLQNFQTQVGRYQWSTIEMLRESLWPVRCNIKVFSGQGSPAKNKMSYLKPSQMIKVCSLAPFPQPQFLRKQLLPWESVWVSGTDRRPCVDGPALLSSLQETRERTSLCPCWCTQSPNRNSTPRNCT